MRLRATAWLAAPSAAPWSATVAALVVVTLGSLPCSGTAQQLTVATADTAKGHAATAPETNAQRLTALERRVEELADIERGLEGAKKNLESCKRRLDRWGISSEDRQRLRFEIDMLETTIAGSLPKPDWLAIVILRLVVCWTAAASQP